MVEEACGLPLLSFSITLFLSHFLHISIYFAICCHYKSPKYSIQLFSIHYAHCAINIFHLLSTRNFIIYHTFIKLSINDSTKIRHLKVTHRYYICLMLFYSSHVHTEKQLIPLNRLIYGSSSKDLMQTKSVTVLLSGSVSCMFSCQV